ncbi:Zn-dependent protease (includes SpoIVFB) [Nakamurella panacisegetis]|uniref:Zn-dependent protease (Includes SpoIVFB) n=1 Tax=Nakamurella panacisegetis TaxID=1090615 RepID=A0A1H0PIU9_9ACTN|nr:site-2 protease family protein [Nakamurella panacisegetis]SDP05022.1 Zn-dependent protease (includes SpoIVFB) [Nakamurella panacisegetis]
MTESLSRQAAGRWVFPTLVVIAVLAGYAAATNATPVNVWIFLLVLAGWVISLCLHEFAHAATALAGGDFAVRARGYLTLNPFRYLNAVYSIVIPVIILIAGGIPLPGGAVLIESHRLRRRWWSSLVSLAGPATNFALGAVLVLVANSLPREYVDGYFSPSGLYQAIAFLALLQFVTAILNILPVPGFDGFGIIAPYLSAATQRAIAPFRGWAPLVVFVILFSIPNASTVLFEPAYYLMRTFGSIFTSNAAAQGAQHFQFWRTSGF